MLNPDENNKVRAPIDPKFNFNMKGVSVGTVVYVDPLRRVAVVTTVDNKKQEVGISQGKGIEGDGFDFLPPSGMKWQAVMSESAGGATFIERFLPPKSMNHTEDQLDKTSFSDGTSTDPDATITGVDDSKSYRAFKVGETKTKLNYRANSYTDAIPGDYNIKTLEGNGLNILRGGINRLFSTRLNQIIQLGEDDLTRILARNFDIFTDAGVVKHVSNGEKGTRVEFKVNSGLNDKYKTWEETYEMKSEIGACSGGDGKTYFFTLEYNTKTNEIFLISLDRQGSMVWKVPKDYWIDVKEDLAITVGKNIGVFGGKEVLIDAGNTVTLKGGASITRNEDNTITTNAEGCAVEVSQAKVKIGYLNQTSKFDALVKKKHLEKFNNVCDIVSDMILNPMLGDLSIPLPFGIRTQPSLMAAGLQLKTTIKDNINFTVQTEAN